MKLILITFNLDRDFDIIVRQLMLVTNFLLFQESTRMLFQL